jgi:hypothetical protein
LFALAATSATDANAPEVILVKSGRLEQSKVVLVDRSLDGKDVQLDFIDGDRAKASTNVALYREPQKDAPEKKIGEYCLL